jgi:hypothetical protein
MLGAAPDRTSGLETSAGRNGSGAPLPQSVIVEFVGIPGAGKSTLARHGAELLRSEGVPVHLHALSEPPRAERVGRGGWPVHAWNQAVAYGRFLPPIALVALRHPTRAALAVARIAASRQRSLRDLLKVVHNLFRTTLLVERARRLGGVHLIDQGVLQVIWAVGFSAAPHARGRVLRLGDALMALPDVAVVVESDLPTIRERLAQRAVPVGRLERELRTDPSALDRAASAFTVVEAVLQRTSESPGRLRVVRVASRCEDDLEQGGQRLLECVQPPTGG